MIKNDAHIHHLVSTLHAKKEVLTWFFLYIEAERKAVYNASHCAAEDVVKVWAKASIPTCLKKHAVKKIEEMFKEHAKLKKIKANVIFFIFILLSQESGGGAMCRTNPDSLRSGFWFQIFRLSFLFTSLICYLPDSTKQR